MFNGCLSDLEMSVLDPRSGSVHVDLRSDGDFCRMVMPERERFPIVAGHEVRIGGLSGLGSSVVPRATGAARLSEFPQVVDHSGPQEGGAIWRDEGSCWVDVGWSGCSDGCGEEGEAEL